MAQLASPARAAPIKAPPRATLPPGVQAKLDVGPSSDHFEQEADQVAASVMSNSAAPVTIPPTITPIGAQRKAAPPKAKEEKKATPAPAKSAQRKPMAGAAKPKEEKKPAGGKGGKAQRKPMAGAAKPKEEKKPAGAKGGKAQRKPMAGGTKPKEEKKPAGAKGGKAQRKPMAGGTTPREEKKPAAGKGGKAQRDAVAGTEGGTASAAVEGAIDTMRAGPAPGLGGGTRSFMESRFGRDFGDVRIHQGTEAAKAADSVGARAFTTGSDIFFNSGQYQPGTHSGRALLAHELTHTVQQKGTRGTVARKPLQRAKTAAGSLPAATPAVPEQTLFDIPSFKGAQIEFGKPEGTPGTIILPVLALPEIAGALKGTKDGLNTPVAAGDRAIPGVGKDANFTLAPPQPKREKTIAAETWTAGARIDLKPGVKKELERIKSAAKGIDSIVLGGETIYYMTFNGSGGGRENYIFNGTIEELADSDELLRPQWAPSGAVLTARDARLDADHFLEAQLGGADDAKNMWLLQASYNRSVGATLAPAIAGDIKRVVDGAAAVPEKKRPTLAKIPTPAEIDAHWAVRFTSVVKGTDFQPATVNFWTRKQVSDGAHLKHLHFMTEDELVAADIKLKPGQKPKAIKVFPGPQGGRMTSFPIDASTGKPGVPTFFYSGIVVNEVNYRGGDASLGTADSDLMTLDVSVFKYQTKEDAKKEAKKEGKKDAKGPRKVIEEKQGRVAIKRNPRLGIAGYISSDSIRALARTTEFKTLSPLAFDNIGVSPEGELSGAGHVATTKPLFPGLNVPLELRGDRIMMNFPIPADKLKLGPLRVTEAALAIGAGPTGVFAEGSAFFEIGSLGKGSVIAEVSDNPKLTGTFDLNTDFLNPAGVVVTYDLREDKLSAKGTLGVQKGKIPGLESGEVTVGITDKAVDVAGTLNLGGPLKGTALTVTYSEAQGLKIGADNIPLPFAKIPAIKNATLSLSAARRPDDSGWSFAGTGQATLAVPGTTGTIGISYLDGAITFTADAALARGPANGTLNFTATNRAIDEEGKPIEGPPTDGINVWGKGSVTVSFGKVLTGTAGVELTPDNRVIVAGAIALPPVFEVFPRRDYTKDLFSLKPPEIPIWGASVLGVGVGIFAFVDARVFFDAYVGPGELRNAKLAAKLDLDHPENAAVTGHAEFHVPAYAGLGLDVGGGLRARAAIAYGQGRVGLTGTLGVHADAAAGVDIAWNRKAGLALAASVSAKAQPKFEISANASFEVGVDLGFMKGAHTFGPWVKQLGSFGPDMALGVTMPVRWSEAKGLDLSLENIQIQRPSLDASSLMMSVFKRLAA